MLYQNKKFHRIFAAFIFVAVIVILSLGVSAEIGNGSDEADGGLPVTSEPGDTNNGSDSITESDSVGTNQNNATDTTTDHIATTDKSTTHATTTEGVVKDTTIAQDTTAAVNGDNGGFNIWGIVIAVLIVAAVVLLIFAFIPKKK